MSQASQPKPPLTQLARKYTHPIGRHHELIARTGKSGLTPIQSVHENGPFPTKNQQGVINDIGNYQKWRALGFTTAELVNLQAFAPEYNYWILDGMPNGGINFDQLNVPIHNLFARHNWDKHDWKHLGKVPIGNGVPGYWTVNHLSDLRRSKN